MVQKFSGWIEAILVWQVKWLIKSHKPKIVAVTGSVGKTSTKAAIKHVLEAKFKVHAHKGNYNSAIGLPLAIFEQEVPDWLANPFAWLIILFRNEIKIWSKPEHEVWVLEMGAERKGEIAKFMEYIKPDIGVVTAVKNVHMESGQFDSLGQILAEKWELAAGSKKRLINIEDDQLKAKAEGCLTYGIEAGDYHFEGLTVGEKGFTGKLKLQDKAADVAGRIIARHSLYALVAAAAVADEFGLSAKEIAKQFGSFKPVSGRMNPLPGKHGTLVIDDTYNSSPDAAVAALETLYGLPKSGRKIAILGSMNELGSLTEPGHKKVGEFCARLDLLVTIGSAARDFLVPSAKQSGLKEDQIRTFNDPYRAGQFVAANLKKGDQVLIKGSQNGVYAEEATRQLLANREDGSELVRQSPSWQERKKRSFGLK